MTAMRKMSFGVPAHVAEDIDAKVASGLYADVQQFLRESVETHLMSRDPRVERWIIEEVGPTYDAYKADPSRLMTEEEVFEGLEARLASRVNKG